MTRCDSGANALPLNYEVTGSFIVLSYLYSRVIFVLRAKINICLKPLPTLIKRSERLHAPAKRMPNEADLLSGKL